MRATCYYWDRSGDGTSGGVDYTTHDVLDGIFANDINGVANNSVMNADGLYGTTDTYRYATLNGVRVALPTHGVGSMTTGYRPGTVIDNSPAGEANPTYNDLLAIWDGYNGTGTGTNINGTPSGWRASHDWSATPSAYGHAFVNLGVGNVGVNGDDSVCYVALQVL